MEELDGLRALVTGGGSGIGAAIAARLVRGGAKVLIVDIDPATSPDVLADVADTAAVDHVFTEVARQLGARFIWTEREDGKMTLRRGFSVSPGERALVVEDVVTTGGSTRDTVVALQAAGADVIAAASIIDRSLGKAEVGVRRVALATLSVPSVEASLCELCKRGEPAIKPGSSKTTLSR